MKTSSLIFTLAFAAFTQLPAVEIPADSCRNTATWTFFNGSEFKGASGGISATEEGLRLDYDFSKGGKYVGIHPRSPALAALPGEFRAEVRADQDCVLNYRLTDAGGRTFQARGTVLKKDQESTMTLSRKGPWQSIWGGSGGKTPRLPLKQIQLIVSVQKGQAQKGSILLRSLKIDSAESLVPFRNLPEFEKDAAGWKLKGKWLPFATGAELSMTAVPTAGIPAELAISLPQQGRDLTVRFALDPKKKSQTIHWAPPFPNGVNPRNIYQITFCVSARNGETAGFRSSLEGKLSSQVNLGKPKNSLEIPSSRLGTCVHFSYAPTPSGAFRGWYPKEKLLNEIQACGFKWIREGLSMKKDASGTWKICDIDLKTLQQAKARGIEQIVCISMTPEESIEEFLKRVDAVVRGSRKWVRVYELGNEPHNFKWKAYHGGTWNGYEKDGTISKWVKEHLKYTNAAADYIKKIYPESTVIGLGACSPTNFHYLNLDVSKNLDGVVDHPYTYSLPPEKIPFGWNLTKRDGIRIGDKEHTFAGLVQSYHDHFRKTGQARSLWVTEFGFTTFWFNGKTEKRLYAGFSEKAQACYLLRRFMESLALPIEVSCQYDFLDDYQSSEFGDESNFGILRGDYSRKPAFYILQRLNSLMHAAEPDPEAKIKITASPLHRSVRRGPLLKWDDQPILAENGIRAYAYQDKNTPAERMVGIWSMLPYSGEFNNRSVSLEIAGWDEFRERPVAINMMSGETYDIPFETKDGKLILPLIQLKEAPLLIKFFKK